MSFARTWRTVRHLTAEQWFFRAICRGKRVVMNAMPGPTRRRIERAAEKLPLPDPASARLLTVAKAVQMLQQAVHDNDFTDPARGRFELLNQRFDFGSAEDISWRGEFNEGNNPLRRMNLAYMGYLVPLMARGEDGALPLARTMIAGLEEQNPWSQRGVFRDVWNAYTASHRSINLLSGLALYRQAGGTPNAAAEEMILQHVRLCVAFIRANLERDLQYNHLLKNFVALAAYCAGLEKPPAQFALLPRAVSKSLRQNVLEEGGHAERCPMYHALGMLDLDILAASGAFEGDAVDQIAKTREKMTRALAIMSHPDGEIALFNDSWIGEAPRADTLCDPAGAGDSSLLPETGYSKIAKDGDAVILDCGPCGPDDNPGHAHADFLSIEASVGTRRLLVDPGVPTYTAGAARDLSRSAASHNGPHFAGAEPIEFWKSFRVGRRGYGTPLTDESLADLAPLWLSGRQSGYRHIGGEVRRWAGLWPGRAMLICDRWDGASEHQAVTRFLVPADWSMDRSGRAISFSRDGVTVRAEPFLGRLRDAGPAHFWPRFGVETPAHEIVFEPGEAGSGRGLAVWFHWGAIDAPDAGRIAALFAALGDC